MKKLFILILVLITACLVAPTFIGSTVETEHQSGINKLNENPAININSTVFTRQWFTGKALTEMTILLQEEGIEDITIIVEENLSFGPIIFTDDSVEFALSHSQADINFKEFIIDEEIENFINDKVHLSALLTFSKNIVSKVVIDEISKEVDGNKVTSAQALGHFTLENNNRVYGNFSWAGLTATTSEENFTLGEVKFSLDQTLIAGDYYQGNAISTGNFDFSMSSIVAKDATNNAVFSLDNLLIKAITTVNDDLMKIAMNYSVDKVETAGQALANGNLDVVFNGLNITVMQEINAFLAELPTDGEEVFTPDIMQDLSALTAKLLTDDPAFEIKDFSVETPTGKIESSMQVSIDNKLFDTTNIMSIIPAIKADANGKAPMTFFVNLGLAPMVDMYVQQGLVVQKEEELSFKVNFTQGQLNVNGQVIPL